MNRLSPWPFAAIVLALFFLAGSDQRPGTFQHNYEYPNDWFFMQRAYPQGRINHQVYAQALKGSMALKKAQAKATLWDFAGPYNSGGRIADVEYDTDSGEIFVGAASGGVFRLAADGSSWESIFDEALSLSIGDIAMAPSNHQVIYVGTGEANCGGGSQTYDGMGIFKSMDGGDSWLYAGLEESRNIGRIVVHPTDPDIVYAAAMGDLFGDTPDRGIYKTTDGGATWEKVLFVSDSTGGIDLVIHPESPEILYAAMWERVRRPDRRSYGGQTCGLYKTTDGGSTWTELTNGLPSPAEDIGRIGIDIAHSDPDMLYAIYADDIGYFKGVYKTSDGGNNWSQTNDDDLSSCFQSYGWWFGRIEVDPTDPEIAYVIGFDLYKTTNGGASWANVSSWDVHVDQHGLFIHPEDNNKLFLGNDGGLYTSENGGNTWTFINILPITQFYTCEIDHQFPQRLYGGTQDNGTNRTLTGGLDDWEHIYGGDGFRVLVDPSDNDYVYAEYQYGGLGRSSSGGAPGTFSGATSGINSSDRKNWNTPVVFDPLNPQILYYGSNKVYRSTNRAVSWSAISPDLTNGPGINLTYGTITTISVSPVNPGIIYAGTDDGNVWVSDDAGESWEQITQGLPNRWVTRVAADPMDEETVYLTFSGYRWNEYLPHVFRSDDKGQNWTDLSSNLPEIPLNDIIIDPTDNNILYVASDAGVFRSVNLGEDWQLMGTNMPLVPVNDLDLHNDTRKLVAATYGRSMYSYDLNQDTITTSITDRTVRTAGTRVHIYPNPVTEASKVRLSILHETNVCLHIADISGNLIHSTDLGTLVQGEQIHDLKTFSPPNLGKGIYLLILETGDEKVVHRFVVVNPVRSYTY
jgi:photosystem II stability/assembly factor-like uncharacterized protein